MRFNFFPLLSPAHGRDCCFKRIIINEPESCTWTHNQLIHDDDDEEVLVVTVQVDGGQKKGKLIVVSHDNWPQGSSEITGST